MNRRKPIFLCLDLQKWDGEFFAKTDWRNLKNNVSLLAKEMEARGIPTVHVAFDKSFTLMQKGIGRFDETPPATLRMLEEESLLQIDLPLSPSSLVAYKRGYSIFEEPSIVSYLRANKYTDIILGGIYEMQSLAEPIDEFCLTASAVAARRAGYGAIIVAECTQRASGDRYVPLDARRKNHRVFGVEVLRMDELLSSFDNAEAPMRSNRDYSRCDIRLTCGV